MVVVVVVTLSLYSCAQNGLRLLQHSLFGVNRYLHDALAQTFALYAGDPDRVVLVGWSRGAIACGAVGLYDDATSSLFKAFIPYSHLDGDCG